MANLSCGKAVRQAREAAGLSQEKLAREADVSYATISRIELLDHVPTVTSLWHIARALKVSMDDLVAEEVAPSSPLAVAS